MVAVLRDVLHNMQYLMKLNLQCHIVRPEGTEFIASQKSTSGEFMLLGLV
jgi:hypothetical protein